MDGVKLRSGDDFGEFFHVDRLYVDDVWYVSSKYNHVTH